MKLYYSPGACSLSPHICARAIGLDIELVKVDFASKKTSDGRDFTSINPKGYVPALELDDGRILTEGPAIAQYLADLKPEKGLSAPAGSFERAKIQEWQNYIGSELHKSFGPLFNPSTADADKEAAKGKIVSQLGLIEKALQKTKYLAGDALSVADTYLFAVLGWCGHVGVDLAKFSAVNDYFTRLGNLDVVKAALAAEQA